MRKKPTGVDQVYVVAWPESGLFKIGYSSRRRWEKFATPPEVVEVYDFESTCEALHIETWLHQTAEQVTGHAPLDRARILLGRNGEGYKECFIGGPEVARDVIDLAMHRALLDADMLEEEQA